MMYALILYNNVHQRLFHDTDYNWCTTDPCGPGAACYVTNNGLSYQCVCQLGYQRIQNMDGDFIRCKGTLQLECYN